MKHFENKAMDGEKALYEAILQLKTEEECLIFFKDLCTPGEIIAMSERWNLAKLLDNEKEKLSYREIADRTKASIATIGRVARFLKIENNCGYRLILDRIKRNKK